MRSFDGAQINLEFSGIPDGVEVTIDAWAATAEDLASKDADGEDFKVDQTLSGCGRTPAPPGSKTIGRMPNSRSTKVGTLDGHYHCRR